MRAEEEAYSWDEIQTYIDRLQRAIKSLNCEDVRQLLVKVVKGYQPSAEIEDVLWKGNFMKSDNPPVVELKKYQSKEDN